MEKFTFALTAAGGALFCSSFLASANGAAALTNQPVSGLTPHAPPLRWSEIGAKAGADYHGDGLSVTPAGNGARLRCAFQRLEGEATTGGLWLVSTVTNAASDRLRVAAASVGRVADMDDSEEPPGFGPCPRLVGAAVQDALALPLTGTVQVADELVRFLRPGLIEEYSVSLDGVRQDFVLTQRPAGTGELQVQLAVSGARVESGSARGSRASVGASPDDVAVLVLTNSDRRIAYSRLRATDATGRELPARMEVQKTSDFGLRTSDFELAVLVDDAGAVYPVRIDPTFRDANWTSMGGLPGADDVVYAAVVDGSGNLYIGGDFTLAGDLTATYIAKWDGSSWSALGSGMNSSVRALAVLGSDLYAGGGFTTAGGSAANYIAKWNGSNWSALGSGMDNAVDALAASGGDLYAGGWFTTAGGSAANYIAKWDGSSWSALGSGMGGVSYPSVYALAVSGSDLYAGGYFTTAGGGAATNIAKWDGNSWSPLLSGLSATSGHPYYGGSVLALAVSGSNVYAGGNFTSAGGDAAKYIAKWDGTSWSALGSGMGGSLSSPPKPFVLAVAVTSNIVYAGGEFMTAGGRTAKFIAKWDGSNWMTLGSGMDGSVYALAVSGSNVFAGGDFRAAGGSAANYAAKWSGSSWTALGSGMNSYVLALAALGSDLYVGGAFTRGGGSATNFIAKWDGKNWLALGSGMDGSVYALAVSGSNVYAGGYFTNAGGVAANYIARWDGNSWSALGSGMDGPVFALAVSGSNLYAGGDFYHAGGDGAGQVAKWDGSSWSRLGWGMDNTVYALAISGNNLYAGGTFWTAGGSPARGIAKWDGSSWSALGSSVDNFVYALAVSGNDVYAGGTFPMAGDSYVGYLAKWDGNSWSAVGSGMNDWVEALAVSGSNVFAGGPFSIAGGSPANRIAKWDGNNWAPLGSGVGGTVYPHVMALAASGGDLYAGGNFTTAGGKVSAYVARAYLDLPTLSIFRSSGDMTLSWPVSLGRFALQQNPEAANPSSWSPANYPLTTNGATKSATVPLTPTNQFFRLIGN